MKTETPAAGEAAGAQAVDIENPILTASSPQIQSRATVGANDRRVLDDPAHKFLLFWLDVLHTRGTHQRKSDLLGPVPRNGRALSGKAATTPAWCCLSRIVPPSVGPTGSD
jgi:hypothetical protein